MAAPLAPRMRLSQGSGLLPVRCSSASRLRAASNSGGRIRLLYKTGWSSPVLHGSLHGGEWSSYRMNVEDLPGGGWHSLELQLNGASPEAASGGSDGVLQFVCTDGNEVWDKPQAGGNYVIPGPGQYRVSDGMVMRLTDTPPVLVISDLDDTMIGDDEATLAFRRWWEGEGALRGGKLAYNTGRALDKFLTLLEEKGHVLPHPDCLISSVGTKIYEFEGGEWVEDAGYSSLLGQGWDLDAVREAAYRAMEQVGKENMHFRPPDEQNDHKVTVGVAMHVLERVLGSIREHLAGRGVTAQLIYSGKGDWRFLDLVPQAAGKLPALEFVRSRWGFGLDQTVACGDSGNDIDMLSGKNMAIAVGNAQPDLLDWMAGQPQEMVVVAGGKQSERLFRASEWRASGILQGLQHFGFCGQRV